MTVPLTTGAPLGIRERFRGQTPCMQLSENGVADFVVEPSALALARERPSQLHVLGWDPQTKRLHRVHLRLWYARWRGGTGYVMAGVSMYLKTKDLDRLGPRLLLDHSEPTGRRVLAWTE